MRNPLLSTNRHEYDVFLRVLVDSRKESKVSQSELAKRIGRTQGYVSKVESGAQRMDIIELHDYCKAISIPASLVVYRMELELSGETRP